MLLTRASATKKPIPVEQWPNFPVIATSTSFKPFWDTFGTIRGACNASQPWSVRKHPKGLNYWIFEVRPGDQWVNDIGGDKERAEISPYEPKFVEDVDYWISYSMNIDYANFNTSGLHLMGQLHATEDVNDEGLSPIFDIILISNTDNLTIRTRTSLDDPILVSPNPTSHVIVYDYPRSTWKNFVHKIRVDPEGSGLLQSWLDGVQIVDYTGAIGYRDVQGPYWKFGLYSAEVDYTRIVKYANMEFGTTDLSDRILNPLAIPEE